MKLKISKLELCLLSGVFAGSLFLGCSSGGSEFKPSNEKEEMAYKLAKETYPDIKFLSYDFIKKELGVPEESKRCEGKSGGRSSERVSFKVEHYRELKFDKVTKKTITEPMENHYIVHLYYEADSEIKKNAAEQKGKVRYIDLSVECDKGECKIKTGMFNDGREPVFEKYNDAVIKWECE